jgi:EAL domain-containing protein (putative c-di-GMP-specific phosphodiesterase class I)
LRTLRAGHRALLRARDEHTLLTTMCEALASVGGYAIAWIEFAEDEPTWRALAREACDAVQGYYVGTPLPVEDFEAWPIARDFAPPLSKRIQ